MSKKRTNCLSTHISAHISTHNETKLKQLTLYLIWPSEVYNQQCYLSLLIILSVSQPIMLAIWGKCQVLSKPFSVKQTIFYCYDLRAAHTHALAANAASQLWANQHHICHPWDSPAHSEKHSSFRWVISHASLNTRLYSMQYIRMWLFRYPKHIWFNYRVWNKCPIHMEI